MNLFKNPHLPKLQEILKQVSHGPGVYLHKDENNVVIYVGKAKNLYNRLRSYFYPNQNISLKTQVLISKIFHFETFLVQNETEALILENNLIKLHRPAYNILLRDDKTYPFIKITADKWPRIFITRRRLKDKAKYYGPFPKGDHCFKLVELIHQYYPLVRCTHHQFKTVYRPCHFYDLGKCLAPCHKEVSIETYQSLIKKISLLLEGNVDHLMKDLTLEMNQKSEEMEYESAAKIRDQIEALKSLSTEQTICIHHQVNFDAWSWKTEGSLLCIYVTFIKNGNLGNSFGYTLDIASEEDFHISDVSTFMIQFYEEHPYPQGLFIPDLPSDEFSDTLQNFFEKISQKKIPIYSLHSKINHVSKEEKTRIHDLLLENIKDTLNQTLITKNQSLSKLEALKDFLGISYLPYHIECFDISTWLGEEIVASQSVFWEAKPKPSDYRRYIIRKGTDDFSSMREVIDRRLKSPPPHLILIDGGEPQIREIMKLCIENNRHDVTFVGIAKAKKLQLKTGSVQKEERIVFPGKLNGLFDLNSPILSKPLKVASLEFQLVTQIRDEAHRFALAFHRSRRDKNRLALKS